MQTNTNGNTSKAIAPKKDKLATLSGLFEKFKPSMAAVMPRHMTPERILKIALSAASRTPLLLQCTPESILLAVMQCAQLGLEPNTPLGLAYLVPYKNNKKDNEGKWVTTYEAQFIPGYRGLVKLAHQSGEITSIRSRVVRDGDVFEVELGSDEHLVHRPNLALGEDDELRAMIAVYAVATFKSGGVQFEVMSRLQVDAIRKRSKASEGGPWNSDYDEMARKTVLRRLCKSLPLSTEMSSALEAQARAEGGEAPEYGELASAMPSMPELATATSAPSATDTMKQQLRQQATAPTTRDPGDDDDLPPEDPPRGRTESPSDTDARGEGADAAPQGGAQAKADLRIVPDEESASDDYVHNAEAWTLHLEAAENEHAIAGAYHKRSGAFGRHNVREERKRATVTALAQRNGGDRTKAAQFLEDAGRRKASRAA